MERVLPLQWTSSIPNEEPVNSDDSVQSLLVVCSPGQARLASTWIPAQTQVSELVFGLLC